MSHFKTVWTDLLWQGLQGCSKINITTYIYLFLTASFNVIDCGTVASQKDGSGFESRLGPFCVEFVFSLFA